MRIGIFGCAAFSLCFVACDVDRQSHSQLEWENLNSSFNCVGSTLFFPNGDTAFVGSSCSSAKLGENFACVGTRLYFADGADEFVGSSCSNATISEGFACVGTRLYFEDGSDDFVGSSCSLSLIHI